MASDAKPKKRLGRPKGRSAQRAEALELIARGVEPLTALVQANYSDPKRIYKKMIAQVAEAQRAEPTEIERRLRNVLLHGASGDVVTAAGIVLDNTDDEHGASARGESVVIVAHLGEHDPNPIGVRIYNLPLEQRDFEKAREALYEGTGRPVRADDGLRELAEKRLFAICGSNDSRDAEAVRAARELLKRKLASAQAADQSERKVFCIPDNSRIPAREALQNVIFCRGDWNEDFGCDVATAASTHVEFGDDDDGDYA